MRIQESGGSLLTVIDKLLRVIDISENSIMIPTLLKDKCEFDAYEMLTMAKILKASILGHNDLVEFYMSDSSSQMHIGQQHKQRYHQHQSLVQLECSGPSSTVPSVRSRSRALMANSASNSNASDTAPRSHRHRNYEQVSSSSLSPPSSTGSTSSSLSSSSSSSSSAHDPNSSNLTLLLHSTADPSSLTSSNSITSSSSSSSNQKNEQLLSSGSPAESEITIKLLLQIETLKSFIPQVTELFEDIIELYKESVDTSP